MLIRLPSPAIPRRLCLLVAAAALTGCASAPLAADPMPESTWWRDQSPQSAACRATLDALRVDLDRSPTTTLMAVHGKDVVFRFGPVDHATIIHSARKSLLAMLYGAAVEKGKIRLDDTLATLGVDDLGGLLPIEREARVRDLLTARSGVYHAAANTGDDSAAAPPRGSQRPGSYFLYNNWDFNAAGDIYEQLTRRDIYQAFAEDIATPLGLEDFRIEREHRSGDATRSIHLAYHFHLSARDMARVGELMLGHGAWNGRQLVPADWTTTITTPVTRAAEMHPPHVARKGIDYGYLWWIPQETQDSPLAGSYFAWGYFGQFLLVVPKRGMVIVHKFDTRAVPGDKIPRLDAPQFLALARRILDAPCPG
ncbi:serine hydrolase domain-containing protein [Roseateles chitosanitabidus]|uniref:serine hydrolase domain-containing protein n=1 Tax=Roseateles chitosanitabidus TaxID=65048 RepID=UPI001FDF3F05|nr:serine hydrolase [Roseateles chitosanitabidus]